MTRDGRELRRRRDDPDIVRYRQHESGWARARTPPAPTARRSCSWAHWSTSSRASGRTWPACGSMTAATAADQGVEAHPLPPMIPRCWWLSAAGQARRRQARRRSVAEHGASACWTRSTATPPRVRRVGLHGLRLDEAAESWQSPAGHPAPAPAARAARARLPRIADPRPVRHRGTRAHQPQSVRADERFWGRVLDRRPDRACAPAGTHEHGRQRQRAAILHALASEAERSGSTCLPSRSCMRPARELLGDDPAGDMVEELERRQGRNPRGAIGSTGGRPPSSRPNSPRGSQRADPAGPSGRLQTRPRSGGSRSELTENSAARSRPPSRIACR